MNSAKAKIFNIDSGDLYFIEIDQVLKREVFVKKEVILKQNVGVKNRKANGLEKIILHFNLKIFEVINKICIDNICQMIKVQKILENLVFVVENLENKVEVENCI